MSWKACGWAKSQRLGSPSAKAILLCLADSAPEPNFYCYASQATIASDSECSPRTVWEWLKRLEEWGLITRSRRVVEQSNRKKARKGGAREADGFTLNLEVCVTDGAERLRSEKNGASVSPDADVLLANIANRSEPSYSQSEHVLIATSDAPTRNHCDTYKEEPFIEPYKRTSQGAREGAHARETDRISDKEKEGEKSLDRAFWKLIRDWPDLGGMPKVQHKAAFLDLSPEDRVAAAANRDRWLAHLRKIGRTYTPAPSKYFGEKLWQDLPPIPDSAAAAAPLAAPFGKRWTAELLGILLSGPVSPLPRPTAFIAGLIAKGDEMGERERRAHVARHGYPSAKAMLDAADDRRGWPVGDAVDPLGADMVPVMVESPEFEVWRAEFEQRGWPWLPSLGTQPVVYFPKGGPDGLAQFASKAANMGLVGAPKSEAAA